MIFETIISTVNQDGEPHVTPFGVRHEDGNIVISPYKPSITLDNILTTKCAVMNLTDDVRVFADALAGKPYPALLAGQSVSAMRLANCLAHVELELIEVHDDALRPQLVMKKVAEFNHKPFAGFNRAQGAVIELAVLVSRLHMLPKEKVMSEKAYLQIAIDKTAGEREIEAWRWLVEKIDNFYAEQLSANQA
jgi:uncharacterized protein